MHCSECYITLNTQLRLHMIFDILHYSITDMGCFVINVQFWMVVFPEGTRYNPDLPDVFEKSCSYAKSHGLSSVSLH